MEVIQSPAPNCGNLRKKNAPIKYIFPISLEEAPRLLPSNEGLERIVGIPDVIHGREDALPYRFFKYKGFPNGWDIAVAYDNSTGQPVTLYHIRGRMAYIHEKGVYISEPNDAVFNFADNKESIHSNFNLDNLRQYISRAYYTCNAGLRWLLDSELKKNNADNDKPKGPSFFKHPPIRVISVMAKRNRIPQKIPS